MAGAAPSSRLFAADVRVTRTEDEMFDQLFESFRKASESSLQAQQEMFKQWVQQWPTAPTGPMSPMSPMSPTGASPEWTATFQKRWIEATTEGLNKHRELLDSAYKAGIQIIEQSFRVSDAKSPDEYRRLVEDLWRKLSEALKEQSEAQFRAFQKASERWMDVAQKAKP
jgi:hypothetical protein